VTFIRKSKLPRLPREFYQGRAIVLWTHTFENRANGWLTDTFHGRFREMLLHTGARFAMACPVYTLMPDHWHIVWMGLSEKTDQRLAAAFLRQQLAGELRPARLQDRAHDHVLREQERERGALMSACSYVRMNPVRAGLAADWKPWVFSGAMVAGYPKLEPREDDFWERFWRIYERIAGRDSGGMDAK